MTEISNSPTEVNDYPKRRFLKFIFYYFAFFGFNFFMDKFIPNFIQSYHDRNELVYLLILPLIYSIVLLLLPYSMVSITILTVLRNLAILLLVGGICLLLAYNQRLKYYCDDYFRYDFNNPLPVKTLNEATNVFVEDLKITSKDNGNELFASHKKYEITKESDRILLKNDIEKWLNSSNVEFSKIEVFYDDKEFNDGIKLFSIYTFGMIKGFSIQDLNFKGIISAQKDQYPFEMGSLHLSCELK